MRSFSDASTAENTCDSDDSDDVLIKRWQGADNGLR